MAALQIPGALMFTVDQFVGKSRERGRERLEPFKTKGRTWELTDGMSVHKCVHRGVPLRRASRIHLKVSKTAQVL